MPIEEDPIQKTIGAFGRYQLYIYLLIYIGRLPTEFQLANSALLLPSVNYICMDDGLNVTNKCPCDEPQFETDLFENTIITYWNLICDKRWYASLTQSMFQAGILCGSIVFGTLSDKFGRKVSIWAAFTLEVFSVLLSGITPEYWSFVAFRFLTGMASGGTMLCCFTYIVEITGKSFRSYTIVLDNLSYVSMYMVVPGIAYALRDFRYLQLACSVFWIFVLSYLWIIPESPRWLIAVGRKHDAVLILMNIAKRNKLKTCNIEYTVETYYEKTHSKKQKKEALKDLFKYKNIRRRMLAVPIIWMGCSFAFFGINQYLGQLSGNVFLNIFIIASLHLPGLGIAFLLAKTFKRKQSLILTFGVACFCLLLLIFVKGDWIRLGVAGTGVVSMFMSFILLYLFSSELFPTVIRNSALGFASVFARLGSFVSPFVVEIGIEWISLVLFCLAAFMSLSIVTLLPETKDIVLQNTLEETNKPEAEITL